MEAFFLLMLITLPINYFFFFFYSLEWENDLASSIFTFLHTGTDLIRKLMERG